MLAEFLGGRGGTNRINGKIFFGDTDE
jgi:hypothetical protein